MQEVWKDVVGFENIYQISNYGRLKSFKNNKNGYILKNNNKNGGYFSVVLEYKNKLKHTKIHRLVAETFIPNPNNYKIINHKDGNKQNNNVENLEWTTQKQNFEHAKKIGLWSYNKPYKSLKVRQYNLNGDFIEEFESCESASRKTGVCSRNILRVANKEPYNKKGKVRKQAGGFVWVKVC